ncbi:MAG TPA: efflux RND transporter permease subunit, partial [Syntrophales bacterium]|nr:efflux RND transporter permease subunit [Syntrophales bacterium]HOL58465.1 efflux RND transporter permease subunit [Syntrophales bacterium]HPO34926.1 efflux RND transporter permease subunit [Syntrophales bacterium]
MWLAKTSIKRPVFATMIIMALVVLGVVSYPEIGVDLFPRVELPIVNIITTLKGASPEIMDIDVTDKIEEAVNTINGVKSITSTSAEGVSSITVEFVLERDIDLAVQDVREKISLVRNKLPTDIAEPLVQKVDTDATPVMYLSLSGQKSVRELSTYADEVLKEQLQRINGVGALRLFGLQLRQVRIWLDADRMRAFNVSAGEVAYVLARENMELPGGRIEEAVKEYGVKVKGELPSAQDFNDLIVAWYKGAPVRIRDIGRAEDGMEERRTISRFNGVPSVNIAIQKQSGTNTVEVIDRVKGELTKIRRNLPPGMHLDIAFDQSIFIKRSIREVQYHLILGGILAVLAVMLFLKNLRVTLISALALPVSVISTFTIMRAFGFTFNNMTMLGLTLSVGILIDDAIIVIENIYRHIEKGMEPREAADFATSEIGLAVMATTLAIVVIFLPVAFMKGIIGRFFMSFSLTVVFAVLVSLLVSFTLTPMLASIYLRARHAEVSPLGDTFERLYKKLEGFYRRLLDYCLDHRGKVLISALIIFVLSLFMTRLMGKEFVPPEDQGRFLIRLEAPIDYSVEKVNELFSRAEAIVRSLPEVVSVNYLQGLGPGGSGQVNRGVIMVNLTEKKNRKRNQEEIKADLRRKMREIPGLKAMAEDVAFISGMGRNVPIQFTIRGSDIGLLTYYTKQFVSELSQIPGIVDIDTSLEAGKPELKVFIDREKAAALGVSVASITEAINLLVSGEVDITKFKDESRGRRYDLRVRLFPEDRRDFSDLGRICVRAKDGGLVELANLITVQEGGAPSTIWRVDRQRAQIVYASLEKKPLGQAKEEIDALAARILPPDFTTLYKGYADTMQESFYYLIFALILGIVLAYMVLAAQFESFIHPITILLSMPLSLIGAFGALLLTGKTINIFSMIGLILLMGLVKKNAILLVDYTNTLRARGLSRRAAIKEAGPVRLRPILMTTFAMVFGMVPVAFGVGEGAETRSPMGVAVIGGLLTSLFLTLLVVPAAYDLFDEWVSKM